MGRRAQSSFTITAVGQDRVSPAMRKAAEEFVAMARKAIDSNESIAVSAHKADKAMKDASGGGLIFAGALQRIGHNAVDIGQDIIVGSIRTMAAALQEATKRAMEFETEAAQVQTIADKSSFSMDRMTTMTEKMADLYGSIPVESVKGLYDAVSAGANTVATSNEVMHAAAKAAVGGNGDLAVSVNGLTNAMNAYAAQGLTAADASDVFFTAVEFGKTTLPELAAQIGNVASVASGFGVQFHELGAAIATATAPGVTTAQAVTQIKAALVAVAKPSKQAAELAKQLGVQFDLNALKSKGLAGFLREVVTESGATKEQITTLFGSVEALNGVMALTAQEGAKFEAVLEGMANRAGKTDAAFERMTQTLGFQVQRFEALKQQAEITLGSTVTKSQGAVEGLTAINTVLKEMTAFLRSPEGGKAVDGFFRGMAGSISIALAGVGALDQGLRDIGEFWDKRPWADQSEPIIEALDEQGRTPFEARQEYIQRLINMFDDVANRTSEGPNLQPAIDGEAELTGAIENRRRAQKRAHEERKKQADDEEEITAEQRRAREQEIQGLREGFALASSGFKARVEAQNRVIQNEIRTAKLLEDQAQERAQAEDSRRQAFMSQAQEISAATQSVLGELIDRNESFSKNVLDAGKKALGMVSEYISAKVLEGATEAAVAKTKIAAKAASAAAGAAESQASIPIIGPVLAPLALAAIFALVSSMASKFNRGGLVPGYGNQDTVPALLTPNEFVIPAELVRAIQQSRPPNVPRARAELTTSGVPTPTPTPVGSKVEIHLHSSVPLGGTAFAKVARQDVVPVLDGLGFTRSR